MFELTDKVAVVTGSSRGIGACIVRTLAEQGAKVVINHYPSDSDQAEAEEVAATIQAAGGQTLVVAADVSQADQAQNLIKQGLDTFGQIDILVNNAGITRDNLLMKIKEEDWNAVLQVNLYSVYHCSKAVIRPMMRKRRGRIINMSSVVGQSGQAGQTNYAASKAGIIGFTKSLAKEVGSRGITVNAIAPGFISTALTEILPEEQVDYILSNTPLNRLGAVEDVAHAVAFLASDEAAFITGQVLAVDGGLVMQ